MKPEEKVKAEHKAFLTSIGAWWFMPVQTGYGENGIPDILACVPKIITPQMVGMKVGLFAGVETRAPGNTPTKWQERQIRLINEAAGVAFWTDSLDYTKTMLKAGGVL